MFKVNNKLTLKVNNRNTKKRLETCLTLTTEALA